MYPYNNFYLKNLTAVTQLLLMPIVAVIHFVSRIIKNRGFK